LYLGSEVSLGTVYKYDVKRQSAESTMISASFELTGAVNGVHSGFHWAKSAKLYT